MTAKKREEKCIQGRRRWRASKSPDPRVQGGARCIAIEGLGPSLAWHLGGGLTQRDSTIPHSPLYIVLWRGRVGDQLAAGHPPVSDWWCGVSCYHVSRMVWLVGSDTVTI